VVVVAIAAVITEVPLLVANTTADEKDLLMDLVGEDDEDNAAAAVAE